MRSKIEAGAAIDRATCGSSASAAERNAGAYCGGWSSLSLLSGDTDACGPMRAVCFGDMCRNLGARSAGTGRRGLAICWRQHARTARGGVKSDRRPLLLLGHLDTALAGRRFGEDAFPH